ncbi:MAG: hypothetical protein AAGU10_16480 [Methanosarcina mazei]
MGCENMDKRKKVSKRNYFRIKHRHIVREKITTSFQEIKETEIDIIFGT